MVLCSFFVIYLLVPVLPSLSNQQENLDLNAVASSGSETINSSLNRFGGVIEFPNDTVGPDVGVISPEVTLNLEEPRTLGALNNQVNNLPAISGPTEVNQTGISQASFAARPNDDPTTPPPGITVVPPGGASPLVPNPAELSSDWREVFLKVKYAAGLPSVGPLHWLLIPIK